MSQGPRSLDVARVGTWLALAWVLTSCRAPEPIDRFAERARQEWHALLSVLTGGPNPLATPAATAKPWGKPPGRGRTPVDTPLGRAHAELLRELFTVVFRREPTDTLAFMGYVDSMNQGASLEGLHNGFTRSGYQMKLESESGPASGTALGTFARLLGATQREMKSPTKFTVGDGAPLAPVDFAEIAREQEPGAVPARRPQQESPPRDREANYMKMFSDSAHALERSYFEIFGMSSIFTLKRVVAVEFMRVIDEKKSDPPELARWYGSFAAGHATQGIPFGLELRHRPESAFHEQWATQMIAEGKIDRIRWEVLNRLHRILNYLHFDLERSQGKVPAVVARPGE